MRVRTAATSVLVVTAAMLLLTACLNLRQQDVYDRLMADRVAGNLPTLRLRRDAQTKAQQWADKLASENRLYHSRLADGISVKWCSIGENVGYGPSVQAIEDAYMDSPGHKANIVSTKWNGVGVGYAVNGKRIFTVQVFIKTC